MNVSQINLVCAAPRSSRRFYELLGLEFRPIGEDAAYLSVSGATTLALHSVDFAAWWDATSPGILPGSGVIDVDVPAGSGSSSKLGPRGIHNGTDRGAQGAAAGLHPGRDAPREVLAQVALVDDQVDGRV